MAATIINVQAIRESIASADKYISAQEMALGEIDKTVNSMSGVWEAEDQRVYADQFHTTKEKIADFNQYVRESLDVIRRYVYDCVSLDEQTERDLNNVSW